MVATLVCLVGSANVCGQDLNYELSGIVARLDALDRELTMLTGYTLGPSPASDSVMPAAYATDSLAPPVPSLDERLKKIEADLKKQADDAAKKKADDALRPTQRWTGRIQADYWAFPHTSAGANAFETGDPNEPVADRFLFRRLRIGIQGQIPDNMLYKLEVDFNNPNNPQLKDNYIGWESLPTLQTLLIGNQKRPYSLDQIHSTRFTIFLERPAIIEAFNQDSRRFGIQSYGYSEDLAYDWRYGVFKSQDIQNLGTVLATPIGDYQAEAAGRLARTWWNDASDGRTYAHTAIAGTVASTDPTAPPNSTAHFQTRPEARTETRWLDTGVIAGANNYELMGLEGVFNYGPLHVEGEFQHVWMQRISEPDLNFSGGYIYAAWFLTGEHMAWDRQTGQLARTEPFSNFFRVRTTNDAIDGGWGAWQVAVRLSHADLSDLNIHGGISNEVTYSLIWYFNSHSKLIFNCITGDIRDRRSVDGLTAANFTMLGTRLAVDF
jgi:phosphate-selective porin OprO/OprP